MIRDRCPVNEILVGDAVGQLKTLPDECIHCAVTSPPYWGLRDYGVQGQIGLEPTPDVYIARLMDVFREVKRVLRKDGTLWLNLGDSYTGSGKGGNPDEGKQSTNKGSQSIGALYRKTGETERQADPANVSLRWTAESGVAPKNLIGIPWRVAFALQADGWYLRQDIVWHKVNSMPESVKDRPTRAHEYVFLLAKSERYYYDAEAIKEPATDTGRISGLGGRAEVEERWARPPGTKARTLARINYSLLGRNRRSVWSIPVASFPEAHFAVFPEQLVHPCILAGCPEGGIVLDPFMGSGTVALVALKAGRRFVGVELNPEYVEMARRRIEPELIQGKLL